MIFNPVEASLMFRGRLTLLILVLVGSSACQLRPQSSISLYVDLRDAPRKLLHTTEILPVQPGPLTLAFPEWIRNEHVPAPLTLLLSRTRFYSAFQITGAGFACVASCAWIVERVLDQPNPIGQGTDSLAHHGVMLAIVLWVSSAIAWMIQGQVHLISPRSAAAYER
jgi:hypothetical protein